MYIKENLPDLIPYATQTHYDLIKSLVTDEGKKLLENTIKMWVKTVDQKTLDNVIKSVMGRIGELKEHFDKLNQQNKILKTKDLFNADTAKAMAKGSISLKGARLDQLNNQGFIGVFNGPGAAFLSSNRDITYDFKKNDNYHSKDNLL